MSRSSQLLARANRVMPGGVCCPLQGFTEVGGNPPFISRGEGPWLFDEEGLRYLDLLSAYGALLFGHAPHAILGAATTAAVKGAVFGAPIRVEVELAEALVEAVPSAERVRLCESGIEAHFRAMHLAQSVTGRERILRTDELGFNDLDAVRDSLAEHPAAAIYTEPVHTRGGLIEPDEGYLSGLAQLAREHGALLLFDERVTGFRLGLGGGQEYYEVTPDLTVLGGVLGGGFPLGAFVGSARIMDHLSPLGPVDVPARHGSSAVAAAASLATLAALTDDVYDRLDDLSEAFEAGLADALAYHGCSLARVGSMFTVYYREQLPRTQAQVAESDLDQFATFFRSALDTGVYLPPAQAETAFLSAILEDRHVDRAVEGIAAALVATAA